jgi:tripartite-type tricarboxylate transporter receptor subunit TctC
MSWRSVAISAAALICIGLGVATVSRQPPANGTAEWPRRPVRIIVPLGAGSSLDLTARLFADRLSLLWKQPVLVENRAGADGIVGINAFLASEPSETLLFSLSSPYVLNPYTHKSLPYDPREDLVPLSAGAAGTAAIVTSANLPASSLKELFALAREKPGQIFWTATPGFSEFVFKAFIKSEAVPMTYVSYKDVASPIQDLAQGRLHVYLTALPPVQPQVRAGNARLLAVNSTARSPAAPDVPTVDEEGFPTLSFDGLSGFFGRRQLAAALREKISADIQSAGNNPELVARLASMGQQVCVGTPAQFSARLEQQRATAARITAMLEFKPE